MPEFIEPMLATLVAGPFDDPDFLFENKWDGFRVQAVVRDGTVRTWTRGRQDAEGYFGPFLDPPTWIDAREAIVDGEVIALDAAGEPSFALLGDPRGRLVYEAFDLMWLDGESLLDRPLEERKERLRARLRADPRVRYTEHVVGARPRLLRRGGGAWARGHRGEGPSLPLRAGPALPGVAQGEDPARAGARGRRLDDEASGRRRSSRRSTWASTRTASLRYAGKVGSGVHAREPGRAARGAATARHRRAALLTTAAAGASQPERTWVRPEVVIRAEFAGWVGDGMVRQASYKGIDRGKDPRSVVREAPS